MAESNELFEGLGLPEPGNPFAIQGTSDETRQSALRDGLAQKVEVRSIDYRYLPIYITSFLLTVIADLFKQDNVFPYNPDDELNSKIIITSNWNRGTIESRDKKPRVIVGFQGAGADNIWIRDNALASLVDDPQPWEEKGAMETMQFRITIIHRNANLVNFLSGHIRAEIAGVKDILRTHFKLQKVSFPSVTGAGLVEELDDVFGAYIDLQIMTIPRWRTRNNKEYIRRIIIDTLGSAINVISGAILQEEIIVTAPNPPRQ